MYKLNIAVLYGGSSPEHEISIKSASTIISKMSSEKYNIIPIYITKEGKWLMYEGQMTCQLANIDWERFGVSVTINLDRNSKSLIRIVGNKISYVPIDIVFPVLHGTNGEDGRIQGIFEVANISYVGCKVLASSVSFDKAFAKIVIDKISINQAKYLVINEDEYENEDDINIAEILKSVTKKIGYPCFVKPSRGGSSIGISKVKNKSELKEAILEAFDYDSKIIVEKAISGREFECAVFGKTNDCKASVVGEVLSAEEFYGYDAKYNNPESKTVVPANISDEISDKIKEISIKIYKALGCVGLSRVDFFVEHETNKIIFNEINTMPGFTNISMYPMLWEATNISTEQIIDGLIEIALT